MPRRYYVAPRYTNHAAGQVSRRVAQAVASAEMRAYAALPVGTAPEGLVGIAVTTCLVEGMVQVDDLLTLTSYDVPLADWQSEPWGVMPNSVRNRYLVPTEAMLALAAAQAAGDAEALAGATAAARLN